MKDPFSVLLLGSKKKAMEIAQTADLNVRNEHGQTLMFAAAGRPSMKGSAEVLCRMLQERGLDVDALDVYQQTPLFAVAREGNEHCADYLIAHGANPNHADLRGETPLCVAFRNSQMELVMRLLKHGASLAVKDIHGGRRPPFFANPIFRRAYVEKRKVPHEALKSPKKRKLTQVGEQPLWKRFRGELSLRCTGPHVMTQWAYQDEIVPEEIIPENKRLDVLAENEEFVVVVPPPEATARIRVLEREFALDHADCLQGHSMHLAMAPDEWCGFAGIPVNEADAHKLIFSLLNKGSDTQALLCCIHKKTGTLRGYLHLGHFNEQTLEIAYLKVQREFQRRGLASLLLEGGLRLARERRKWTFHEISLNVATRNVNAVRFYESKGFKHCGRPKNCGRPKRQMSAFSEWSTMKKQL